MTRHDPMRPGHAMLQVENLRPAGRAGISFNVSVGTCMAVVGPSGSGKTLLLRAIADLDPADGSVSLNGLERSAVSGPAWRRTVRYVAAEPGWWAPTPREHFAEGDLPPSVTEHLELLGLQRDILARPIAQLSTGERLRLALIRALADNPPVLLLDEPTAALDRTSSEMVATLIRHLLDAGRTIVLVSHDEGQIGRLADARLSFGDNGEGPVLAGAP